MLPLRPFYRSLRPSLRQSPLQRCRDLKHRLPLSKRVASSRSATAITGIIAIMTGVPGVTTATIGIGAPNGAGGSIAIGDTTIAIIAPIAAASISVCISSTRESPGQRSFPWLRAPGAQEASTILRAHGNSLGGASVCGRLLPIEAQGLVSHGAADASNLVTAFLLPGAGHP